MTVTPTSDGHSTMYAIGDWAAVNNGQPYVDADGCWWSATHEEGWSTSPDPRVTEAKLPGADGQLSGDLQIEPRPIILGGTVRAPTQLLLQVKIDEVAALLSGPVREDTLLVAEPHLTRHATVRRDQRTPAAKVSPFVATWMFQLIADDPRRYRPAQVVSTGLPSSGGGLVFPLFQTTGLLEFGAPGASGQVTLLNPGSADAFPSFTITGPVLGGVVITDIASGRQIVYAGDVPDAAVLLIIDTAFGRATLNGADRTAELTVKQWFPVPAGGSSTVQFATLGAAGQLGQLSASLEPADA